MTALPVQVLDEFIQSYYLQLISALVYDFVYLAVSGDADCICVCVEERKLCDGLKLASRPHSTPLTLKW